MDYQAARPYFNNITMVQHLVGKKFIPEEALKDHWMNTVDDYDVCIRDYCRMSLHIVEKVLNIDIPIEAWDKDVTKILDPL